jgi:hypothetical protein
MSATVDTVQTPPVPAQAAPPRPVADVLELFPGSKPARPPGHLYAADGARRGRPCGDSAVRKRSKMRLGGSELGMATAEYTNVKSSYRGPINPCTRTNDAVRCAHVAAGPRLSSCSLIPVAPAPTENAVGTVATDASLDAGIVPPFITLRIIPPAKSLECLGVCWPFMVLNESIHVQLCQRGKH